MSQTGSAGSQGDGGVQPLVIYNSVHHREQNAIDCANDAAAEIAARIYNSVMLVQGGITQSQIPNVHPLNFANIANGGGNLSSLFNNELGNLVNIARGNAEAQEVLLENYERIMSQQIATATAANAELVAALGVLDANIRQLSEVTPLQRG